MTSAPQPTNAPSGHTSDAPATRTPWTGALAGLSLLWLVATLVSVRRGLGPLAEFDPVAAARAAVALPSVTIASLVAGVAVGLATVTLVTRRAAGRRPALRYGVGAGTGALLGGAVAAAIAVGYSELPSRPMICAAIVATAGVGGLLAAAPPPVTVAAGVLGSLGVFLVGLAVALFDGDLLALFGAGETHASILTASAWVAFVSSLSAGLVAGFLAYTYLRRYGDTPRWPQFLVAGAAPGVLVLIAEALTRLGGAQLFQLVSEAAADETYLQYLAAARLNRALIVLFAGALVAIFLLGRSLPPSEETSEEHDEDSPQEPGPSTGA